MGILFSQFYNKVGKIKVLISFNQFVVAILHIAFLYSWANKKKKKILGAVARSEACPLGMQAAPSSIPTSRTFFHGNLVMKTFLRPFSLIQEQQLSVTGERMCTKYW